MTTKTSAPLEARQRAAAEEAERLAQELTERNAARQAAEDAARLQAAHAFVDVELTKISGELSEAEARLDALATTDDISIENVWADYLTVRTLARTRHDRHNVANGALDTLDPLPSNHIGAEQSRRTVEDTWALTPWTVLVDRILERRLTQASSTATAAQWAVLDAAAAAAGKRFED
jgi:hypothetical protein